VKIFITCSDCGYVFNRELNRYNNTTINKCPKCNQIQEEIFQKAYASISSKDFIGESSASDHTTSVKE
jgi:predicted Zn-ribbon and HTH transcriptional regulator